MARIAIKRGFGTIRRTGEAITLFHVVVDGRTVASFDTYHVAWHWTCKRYNVQSDKEIDISKVWTFH